MRKRKNPDFTVVVYKYWCEPRGETWPQVVWDVAKDMQGLWNSLVAKLEEFKAASTLEQKLDWKNFQEEALLLVDQSPLNWEQGPAVFDRFMTTCRRLGKGGGGWPRLQRRLDHFAIPHRFTEGGAPLSRLFSPRSKRIHLQPVKEEAYQSAAIEHRRQRFTHASFSLRDEDIQLITILHRPFPEGAIVKLVALCGKRAPIGRWEYSLNFTVEYKIAEVERHDESQLGLDLGWRVMHSDDGDYLRIGMGFDPRTKGFTELKLPLAMPTFQTRRKHLPYGFADLIELDRKLGLELEACKARIKPLLEEAKKSDEEIQGLLRAFHLARNGALFRLRRRLQETARLPEVVEILNYWAMHNDRLRRLRHHLNVRLMGHRRYLYQQMAHDLCRRYAVIGWEGELGLREMSEEKDLPHGLQAAQHYRSWAALFEFRKWLKNTAGKYGTKILDLPVSYTTTTCWICGEQAEGDRAKLIQQCPKGHKWDQDENAARNLIAQIPGYLEQPGGLRKKGVRDKLKKKVKSV